MRLILLLLLVNLNFQLVAQDGSDLQLAQYYYAKGEFDKAMPYCQKVFQKDNSKFNFNRYYECLLQTKNEKDAEKLLKKQISANKTDFEYSIKLGELYQQQENQKDATKVYQNLIDDYAKSSYYVIDLYLAFKSKKLDEFAFQTLEKGRKSLKNDFPLNLQFAEHYLSIGNTEKMIEEYLDYLDKQSSSMDLIQASLSKNIDFSISDNKNVDLLKEKLLEKVQKKPNDYVYAEMLIWLFIQKNQFSSAIIQAQSLDKRERGEGYRVLEIGNMCMQNKNFADAQKAYKYVLSLGIDKQFYFQAEYALLNARYTEIVQMKKYTENDLRETIAEYQKILDRVGINNRTVEIIKELALIQAFYANKSTDAVSLLNQALNIPGITSMQNAELKMILADIYVLQDDIWEASLLYMQIDKDFKFEPIGSEAKFKNARIFYYDGDFKFAQSQLDILKQSTSKLIANDAMQLSILITDNYGLDSNFTAMSKFAQADLLLEQHQYDKAFELYDSIIKDFPFHGLSDEILYRKAQAMQQQGKWSQAINYYEELLKYHAQDILADDAIFQMGIIYENNLNDKEKAQEMFKKILFEYKGSIFSSEARKKIRILRGDKMEEGDL